MKQLDDGIYAAVLTPLNDDLSCDHQELALHCKNLIQRGCQGVVLFGTTGEGASFSVKERLEALNCIIENNVRKESVILANGGSNIPETIELISSGINVGVNTFLLCPPTFYRNVKEDGVYHYYKTIINRIDHPNWHILLYHIPQHSVPLSLSTIQKLREEFPNIIIGIKESEGNLLFTKQILEECPNFKVYVGNESQIIDSVAMGGSGSICGISNLFPELLCKLYQQGRENKREAHDEFIHIFNEIKKNTPFIPYAKSMIAKERGLHWNRVRPPLTPK